MNIIFIMVHKLVLLVKVFDYIINIENIDYIVKKEPIIIDMEIIKSIADKIETGGSMGGNA